MLPDALSRELSDDEIAERVREEEASGEREPLAEPGTPEFRRRAKIGRMNAAAAVAHRQDHLRRQLARGGIAAANARLVLGTKPGIIGRTLSRARAPGRHSAVSTRRSRAPSGGSDSDPPEPEAPEEALEVRRMRRIARAAGVTHIGELVEAELSRLAAGST